MSDEPEYTEQWEYRTALYRPQRAIAGIGGYQAWYLDLIDDRSVPGRMPMTEHMNRLGAEGWELCSTAFTPKNSLLMVFCRLRS